MKFFEGITTIADLKKAYHRLAVKYHPDMGGDKEIVQQINAEYESLFNSIKNNRNESEGGQKINEVPEQFINVISKIIALEGIEIEICGAWVWVGGNTKPHKNELKADGMYWASKKCMWYWRVPEDVHKGKGSRTMEQIRENYGSQKIAGGRNFVPALSA